MRTIAIIPARGGSKGIPKKNIISLRSKPLIQYSIDAARDAKIFDKIVLSSDDPEILKVGADLKVEILNRPKEIAGDNVSMNPVIEHVLSQFPDFCTIVLLQPTSPLRTAFHIREAYDLYLKEKPGSLVSVFIPSEHPYKSFVIENNGRLVGAYSELAPFTRRQELPEVYLPNGAIYIFSKEDFKENNAIPMRNLIPYFMNVKDSIDIDSWYDLKTSELILEGIL